MKHSRLIQIVLLVVGVVCIWASGRMHAQIDTVRGEVMSYDDLQRDEDVSPTVKLVTVMLGPFRGVMADVLWIRATRLQDEGKFFELVQLSDLITKLEPRSSEVWDYHGWNLMYNVSVSFDAPEDRWRWVYNGMSLMRDEGLKLNPANSSIYNHLAWMFQHKMGMNSDDAHGYYKREWFKQIAEVMPDGRLASMPFPESLTGGEAPSPYDEKAWQALLDEGTVTAQQHALITRFKFRVDVLTQVDEEYGPFDWRLVQAHAVYWSLLGLEYAKGFTREQLYTKLFQSMGQQFEFGEMIELPETDALVFHPDFSLIPKVMAAYNRAISDFPDRKTFTISHQNFLGRAVEKLYLYGQQDEAQAVFNSLTVRYPDEKRPGFEDFLLGRISKDSSSINQAEAFNQIMHYLSLSLALKTEDPKTSESYEEYAKFVHTQYGRRIGTESQARRVGLPDWPKCQELAQQVVDQRKEQVQYIPNLMPDKDQANRNVGEASRAAASNDVDAVEEPLNIIPQILNLPGVE